MRGPGGCKRRLFEQVSMLYIRRPETLTVCHSHNFDSQSLGSEPPVEQIHRIAANDVWKLKAVLKRNDDSLVEACLQHGKPNADGHAVDGLFVRAHALLEIGHTVSNIVDQHANVVSCCQLIRDFVLVLVDGELSALAF